MIRKAALVGCRQGPWISLAGMKEPRLRAQFEPGTTLKVVTTSEDHYLILEPGDHPIGEALFAQVSVWEGNHESVLCDFVCRT